MDSHELDVQLRWQDDAPVERQDHDRYDGDDRFEGDAEDAAALVEVAEAAVAPASAESFQFNAERERLIEAALRQMSDLPLARIHAQLMRIADAMERGADMTSWLDEVDAWLGSELAERAAEPFVGELSAARASVADALHLYFEVSGMLRAEDSQVVLARRLAEQAAGFLLDARDALWQARPEGETSDL